MFLSGPSIIEHYLLGDIQIEPFSLEQVQPNSYDVRLGRKLGRYVATELDCKRPHELSTWEIPEEGELLVPGRLYLGETVEVIGSTRFRPSVTGKSGVGRLGIGVHKTAGLIECGFLGTVTLEISVVEPVRIYADQLIGQIEFAAVMGDVVLYDGSYVDQRGPTASRLWRSF